jgi:hypothetical protein
MPRFLCDPAKAFLDALRARGESLTMPSIELSEPVPPLGFGQDAGDTLVRQLVVQASLVSAAGTTHPGLIFTGRGLTARLPQWTYVGTDEELRAAARLVHDMAELAIRRADAENGSGRA